MFLYMLKHVGGVKGRNNLLQGYTRKRIQPYMSKARIQ